jgi:hypothetical protein
VKNCLTTVKSPAFRDLVEARAVRRNSLRLSTRYDRNGKITASRSG